MHHLIELPAFKEMLNQKPEFKKEFDEKKQPFDDKLDELYGNPDNLPEGEYLSQINSLQKDWKTDETELLSKWAEQLIARL